MLAPIRVLSLMPIMSWNTAICCDRINPTLTHIKINKLTKMMTDMNMEAIFVVMNTPWAVMKIKPEKKFRPVRNNKNNSILAKFATYDGFMVKKKILAFLNLSSRRSKMPTLFAEFHLKKKPNLLADSKTCRLNIVTTILSLPYELTPHKGSSLWIFEYSRCIAAKQPLFIDAEFHLWFGTAIGSYLTT